MPTPSTKIELDIIASNGCQHPDCRCRDTEHNVLFFVQKCHPGSGTDTSYNRKTGTVSVACHVCGELIIQVKVSD